jgi:dolichyl-phosphate beta-glucosyltransferase
VEEKNHQQYMKEYSIVIPAYNEADKITSSLTKIDNYMTTFSGNYEIVVVDDGSTDQTAKIVEEFSADHPNVLLIKIAHKGKGIAVWTGVMRAAGKYIYMCDADLSTPISELKKLSVWMIDQNFDIVIASREGIGAQRIGEPLYRHVMGRGFNWLTQIIAISGINDTQCGFKLFKSDVAKELFSTLRVYNPQSGVLKNAYVGAFDVEFLVIARRRGYKIKEVPVVWKYVNTTRVAPITDSLKMFRDVIKIKINDLQGLYNRPKHATE